MYIMLHKVFFLKLNEKNYVIGHDVDIPILKYQTFSAFILPQSKHVL